MHVFWRLDAEVIGLHSLETEQKCSGPLPASGPPFLSYLLDPDPPKNVFLKKHPRAPLLINKNIKIHDKMFFEYIDDN